MLQLLPPGNNMSTMNNTTHKYPKERDFMIAKYADDLIKQQKQIMPRLCEKCERHLATVTVTATGTAGSTPPTRERQKWQQEEEMLRPKVVEGPTTTTIINKSNHKIDSPTNQHQSDSFLLATTTTTTTPQSSNLRNFKTNLDSRRSSRGALLGDVDADDEEAKPVRDKQIICKCQQQQQQEQNDHHQEKRSFSSPAPLLKMDRRRLTTTTTKLKCCFCCCHRQTHSLFPLSPYRDKQQQHQHHQLKSPATTTSTVFFLLLRKLCLVFVLLVPILTLQHANCQQLMMPTTTTTATPTAAATTTAELASLKTYTGRILPVALEQQMTALGTSKTVEEGHQQQSSNATAIQQQLPYRQPTKHGPQREEFDKVKETNERGVNQIKTTTITLSNLQQHLTTARTTTTTNQKLLPSKTFSNEKIFDENVSSKGPIAEEITPYKNTNNNNSNSLIVFRDLSSISQLAKKNEQNHQNDLKKRSVLSKRAISDNNNNNMPNMLITTTTKLLVNSNPKHLQTQQRQATETLTAETPEALTEALPARRDIDIEIDAESDANADVAVAADDGLPSSSSTSSAVPNNFTDYADNRKLLRLVMDGLGLQKLPDMKKLNISQAEYASKYREYLRRVHERKRRELAELAQPEDLVDWDAAHAPLHIVTLTTNASSSQNFEELPPTRRKRDMSESAHLSNFTRRSPPRKRHHGEKTHMVLHFTLNDDAAQLQPDDIEEANIRLMLIHSAALASGRGSRKNKSKRKPCQNGGAHPPSSGGPQVLNLKVYQRLQQGKRRWLDGHKLSIEAPTAGGDETHSQWLQFNVTRAVESWLRERHTNLGLEVQCDNCQRLGARILNDVSAPHDNAADPDYPMMPVLNIIGRLGVTYRKMRTRQHSNSAEAIPPHQHHHHHHSVAGGQPPTTTSHGACRKPNQRCCRHNMEVVFKEIKGFEFIIQPKVFDAGYCHGRCPPRYNPAHHHAMLQSLIWKQSRDRAPRPCCAPSKLVELEVLHVDEKDSKKLKISTWTDMRVIECACS